MEWMNTPEKRKNEDYDKTEKEGRYPEWWDEIYLCQLNLTKYLNSRLQGSAEKKCKLSKVQTVSM